MISLKAIEAKLKRFDDNLCQGKRDVIIARKELLKELDFSEDEAQQKTLKALEAAEKAFTETKQNRYVLYEIYYTLRVKYPHDRDVADLAKELLDSVTEGEMKQQKLEELRATIGNMLGQQDIPSPAKIKALFEPLLLHYGNRETKEKMLQEIEQRRVLAEQRADVEEQRGLVLQQQILELKRQLQTLQAKESLKIVEQHEELSPVSSSSGGPAQHSPQQHGVVPSSPVITAFNMGTTRAKQPLSEKQKQEAQEQHGLPTKKQCLHPSQDS